MPEDDPQNNDAPTETFDAVKAAAELAAALGDEPATVRASADESPTNYTAILEDEVETLTRLIEEKEQALQAAKENAASARAEVDRARARLERDATITIERKRRDVIVSFLDIADDLDRAASELNGNGVPAALAQGVTMVVSKLETVLIQHGAKRRPSLGEPFDSAHHEAVGTVPATEETPAGQIAVVLREGYELGEQTLRPARVVVAKD